MRYEVEKDRAGKWRWRLRAKNGRIIATGGGDGYGRIGDCLHAIGLVMQAGDDNTEVVIEGEPKNGR
jgi:uncharacterized protein YegP (UPF0339 family)